jgi:PAS domain-containing protein
MTDGFAVLDREGRVSYFNRVAGELLLKREGTRDGVMGISFWELIPEFKGTGVEEEFQRALAEQTPVQFEIFYPRTESWYEVRGYPSEEGLSLYFRDVTEARRLREGWVWG